MKKILLLVLAYISILAVSAQCPESFHDFSATDINGNNLDMSTFAGKKVLVVNTASYCGYTHQYGQLQTLYNTYGGTSNPYNFEIIGFPANDFANQEPYDEDSIIDVCESYGVTFTMMSKVSVKAPNQHVIYQWLTQQSRNCVQNAAVTWNFQKFMINADGSWHGVVTPATSPLHTSIVNWITSMADVDSPQNAQQSFDAYVAPMQKTIHISTQNLKSNRLHIRLLSTTGQHIATIFEGTAENNMNMSHSFENLSNGIYIIQAISDKRTWQQKVVLY